MTAETANPTSLGTGVAHTHTHTAFRLLSVRGCGAAFRGSACSLLPTLLDVSKPTYTVTAQHRRGISPGETTVPHSSIKATLTSTYKRRLSVTPTLYGFHKEFLFVLVGALSPVAARVRLSTMKKLELERPPGLPQIVSQR